MSLVYLDNNATTQPADVVLTQMLGCLRDDWGNPSSMHRAGAAAKARLSAARARVAGLIGAKPADIIFTGSATEANHMAIRGALAVADGRRHIVASAVEHPSSMLLLRHLQASGVRISWVGVDADGQLRLDQLAAAVGPNTALVSLMWANNETGVIFPVAEAARIAKAHGALFHTDAVQAAGRLPIDLTQVPADFLTLAGHKLHAAKGVGALFVRKGLTLPPLLFGHQERGRRGGTENLAGIVGLGAAADLAARDLAQAAHTMQSLRERLEQGLQRRLPQARVNAAGTERLPNTSSVRLDGLDAEFVLDRLDRLGICASSGSACTAGGTVPSHVLLAMGLSPAQALATLRFSLSRYTRADEIDALLDALPDIVQQAPVHLPNPGPILENQQ